MALAFKEWAASEDLVTTAELDQLKDTRIVIDAEDYLLDILSSAETREPLLPALGGLPFALRSRVESDLENFKAARITPSFVFNGLDLACRDRASILKDGQRAMKALDQAWKDYDDSQGELAVSNFGKACTYRIQHVVRSLFVMLNRRGVFVYRAPYTAASQMATFERDGCEDAVAGSVNCLVYGSEKVITSFDFESGRFSWIELKQCLAKLGVNREQFVDICLLSGSSICPIFPEIDSDVPGSKMSAARAAMSRAGNDAYALISKDPTYTLTFHKARFALKHPVVVEYDGKVQPKAWETAPSDVHEFIGQRLPEELYEYLCRGIIGPKLLNWRTRREVLEIPPLDGGHSQTYKELVEQKLVPLRAQALALITHSLHRYYQNTDVSLVCWFQETERSLNVRDIAQPTKIADSWHVKLSTLAPESLADMDSLPFSCAVKTIQDKEVAKKTVTPRQPSEGQFLKGEPELRANVVWRFLADRGYIDATHNLTRWGTVLQTALDRAKESGIASRETDEIVFVALELIRLDLLNNKQLFQLPPYTGAPIRGSDVDKANTMLISRVACLGTLNHAEIGYTGPLSRHLLAYGQVAAAVRESLRDLLETHTCNILFSGAVDRSMEGVDQTNINENLTKIGGRLPLLTQPDLGLALVVKSYLDELSSEVSKRQDIKKWFNHAQDISGDLRKTWKLWDSIVAGVQVADNQIINAGVKKMFQSADDWLKAKLKVADGPNGTA